jgi:hypothetical protein
MASLVGKTPAFFSAVVAFVSVFDSVRASFLCGVAGIPVLVSSSCFWNSYCFFLPGDPFDQTAEIQKEKNKKVGLMHNFLSSPFLS